jgi:hypothetical protein
LASGRETAVAEAICRGIDHIGLFHFPSFRGCILTALCLADARPDGSGHRMDFRVRPVPIALYQQIYLF